MLLMNVGNKTKSTAQAKCLSMIRASLFHTKLMGKDTMHNLPLCFVASGMLIMPQTLSTHLLLLSLHPGYSFVI
uniref:Uncharacterized protein n=1 Tax=Arundo donax TaxID=35708 RepID=A0A0A9GKR7_ARUDO